MPSLPEGSPIDVTVSLVGRNEIEMAWSGPSGGNDAVGQVHGGPLRVRQGRDNDTLISYADYATFHVDAASAQILCAPIVDDSRWKRELLDSVLWLTALGHGREIVHAGAVEGSEGAVAVIARTGGGKSSVVAELVRRGNPLFCDDVLALNLVEGNVIAYPAPSLMNIPERFAGGDTSFGQPVARIEDEIWTTVEPAAVEPRRVAAICFLDRSPSASGAELTKFEPSVVDLLPHMFTDPFRRDREATAFLHGSALLNSTPAWRLLAATDISVEDLADLISELPGLSFAEVA